MYELVWAIIFVSWVICGFSAWFFTDVCHDVCWRSHVIKRLPGNALTNYHSAECNLKYEVHVLMGSIWCVRYILRYDIGRWSFSILWWFAGSNSFMNLLLGRCLCRFDSHTYLVNLSPQVLNHWLFYILFAVIWKDTHDYECDPTGHWGCTCW